MEKHRYLQKGHPRSPHTRFIGILILLKIHTLFLLKKLSGYDISIVAPVIPIILNILYITIYIMVGGEGFEPPRD